MEKTRLMLGFTNYLPKTKRYLLFADLDGVSSKFAREQFNRYRNSDCVMLSTQPRHYWFISLNPLSYKNWVLSYWDSADDWRHVGFSKKWGRTVFRLTRKRRNDSIKLVSFNFVGKPISSHHFHLLKTFFPSEMSVFDSSKKIQGGIEFSRYRMVV